MSETVAIEERPILFSGPMVRALLEGRKTQTRRVVKFKTHPAIAYVKGAGKLMKSERCGVFEINPAMAKRRCITPNYAGLMYPERHPHDKHIAWEDCGLYSIVCPLGAPGDRLWVRETWARTLNNILFAADCVDEGPQGNTDDWDWNESCGPNVWRPSIFMRRSLSRIKLEITEVRVERVQSISEADAIAEGIQREDLPPDPGMQAGDKTVRPRRMKVAFPKGTIHVKASEAYRELWNSINAKRGFGWDVNPWVWVVSFKRIPQ